MNLNVNLSQQQLSTLAKRLKISEDEIKKQAQTQNEQENDNLPEAGSVGVNDTEGSLQALDSQALLNAMLVNNKAKETGGTTYTFDKSKKSQTIVVNGQSITVSATVSGNNSLKIVVGEGGKINVYSDGATAINFSKAKNDLNINIETSTANLTVTGGSGNDTITVQKGAKVAKIDSGKGDDVVVNAGANNSSATIAGGEGNDIIFNNAQVSKIDTGKGDDNIFNLENATVANIVAGDGSDSIVNFGSITTKLDAGAGNDNIFNYGSAKNITGGAGTDTLSGTGSVSSITTTENAGSDFSGTMNSKLYVKGQLANGQVDGKMYKDGVIANKVLINNKYYEKGVLATAVYDKKQYVNGALAQGLYNKKMYKDGELVTGVVDNKYYKSGVLGTGVVDNKYYKSGVLATGTVSGKQYVNGELAQGLYNNKYYENGVNNTKFTGEFEGKYFEKGVLYSGTKNVTTSGLKTSTTYKNGLLTKEIVKNSKNTVLYQKDCTYDKNGNLLTTKEIDHAYKYSKSMLYTFEVKYENNQPTYVTRDNVPLTYEYQGLMFKDGALLTGVSDGKYYVDGIKAHGITYNNILYFDGRPIANRSDDGIYYSVNGNPLNSDYYLDGKRRLFQDGVLLNGVNNTDNKMYKDGIIADNTTVDGIYYINGSAAQGIYNGKCYYDGYILSDDVQKTFKYLNSLDAEELEKSVGNNTLNVSKESCKNIYTISSSKTSQTISVNGQQINVITKIASGGSIEIVIDENNNINVYSKGKNTISFEKATQNLCINIQQNTEGVLNVTGGKGNDIISVSKNATVNINDFSGNNIITNHGNSKNINANGIIINNGCVDKINTGNANNRICNYGQVKEGIFCGSGIDSIEGSGKQNGLALIVNNVEVIADNVEGFVNGKYYKNGLPATGEYQYYIPETKEHPPIDSRSYYFNNGELLTGLADNGIFYVKGTIYTGEYGGKWYYKGEERSQDAVIFLYNDEKGYYGAQEYPLLISVELGNDYAEKVVNSKRELERFEAYYKNLAKRDGYESVSFGYTHSSAYKDWLKTPASSRPPSMPAFVTGGSSFKPYTARWTINGYTFEHRISSANEYAYYDAYYANISSSIANATEAQLRNFLTRFKSTNANGVYSSGNSSINSGSSKSYSATSNGSSGRSSSTRRTNNNSNNTYFQSDVLPAQEYVIVNDSPIDLDGGGFHGDLYFTGGEAYIWNYEQNAYNLAALAYNDDETENPNPEDNIEDQECYYEPYEFENFEELMMLLYATPYISDEELTPETLLPPELDLAFKPTGLLAENYKNLIPTNEDDRFRFKNNLLDEDATYDDPFYTGYVILETGKHATIYDPQNDLLIFVDNDGNFVNSIPDYMKNLKNGEINLSSQGNIGDCWLLSSLNSLSYTEKGRELIKNTLKYDDEKGCVNVTFPGIGVEIEVPYSSIELSDFARFDNDVVAFEKAFDTLLKEGYRSDNELIDKYLERENSINGGNSEEFIALFLGQKTDSIMFIDDNFNEKVSEKLSKFEENNNQIAEVSFRATKVSDNIQDINGKEIKLESRHAYAVKNVEGDVVTITNPWASWEEIKLDKSKFIDMLSMIDDYDLSKNTEPISGSVKKGELNSEGYTEWEFDNKKILKSDSKKIEETYDENGKMKEKSISDYDPTTGKNTKYTNEEYDENGKVKEKSISDYDPTTGKKTKYTNEEYDENGKVKKKSVSDYDSTTGERTKLTNGEYDENGKVKEKSVSDYDSTTGKKTKWTNEEYDENGKLKEKSILDYDPTTGKKTKWTREEYGENGKVINRRTTIYDSDGNVIE